MSRIVKLYLGQFVLLIALVCSTVAQKEYFYISIIIGAIAAICGYFTLNETILKYRELRQAELNEKEEQKNFYSNILESIKSLSEENKNTITNFENTFIKEMKKNGEEQKNTLNELDDNINGIIEKSLSKLLDKSIKQHEEKMNFNNELFTEIKKSNEEQLNMKENSNKNHNQLLIRIDEVTEKINTNANSTLKETMNKIIENINSSNLNVTNVLNDTNQFIKKLDGTVDKNIDKLIENQSVKFDENKNVIISSIDKSIENSNSNNLNVTNVLTENSNELSNKLVLKLDDTVEKISSNINNTSSDNINKLIENQSGSFNKNREALIEGINKIIDNSNILKENILNKYVNIESTITANFLSVIESNDVNSKKLVDVVNENTSLFTEHIDAFKEQLLIKTDRLYKEQININKEIQNGVDKLYDEKIVSRNEFLNKFDCIHKQQMSNKEVIEENLSNIKEQIINNNRLENENNNRVILSIVENSNNISNGINNIVTKKIDELSTKQKQASDEKYNNYLFNSKTIKQDVINGIKEVASNINNGYEKQTKINEINNKELITILQKNNNANITNVDNVKNELVNNLTTTINKNANETIVLLEKTIKTNKDEMEASRKILSNINEDNKKQGNINGEIAKVLDNVYEQQVQTNKKITDLNVGINKESLNQNTTKLINNINDIINKQISQNKESNNKTIDAIKEYSIELSKIYADTQAKEANKLGKYFSEMLSEISKISEIIKTQNSNKGKIVNKSFDASEVAVDSLKTANKSKSTSNKSKTVSFEEHVTKDENGTSYYIGDKLIKQESNDGNITELKYDGDKVKETITKKDKKIVNQCLFQNGVLNESKFYENGKLVEHYFYYPSKQVKKIVTYTAKGTQTVEFDEKTGERKR